MNEKIMKQEAQYDWLKDEVHCLYEEKKELKARIDKAIEYIENHTYDRSDVFVFKGFYPDFYIEKVLDILKGSDKNVD